MNKDNNNNTSLVDSLIQARNSLTPDNWMKGSYFQVDNNRLCMCAHGAVQAIVNPDCRKAILYTTAIVPYGASYAAGCASRAAAAATGKWSAAIRSKTALIKVWNDRPSWIKDNKDNYGNLEAHYLLGMVGLTTSFNDHTDTTLDMIKEKFNEAIELAKFLEV